MDILYRHVLQTEPPRRKDLYLPTDPTTSNAIADDIVQASEQPPIREAPLPETTTTTTTTTTSEPVPSKKRKRAEMRSQKANNNNNNNNGGNNQSSKKTDERMSINLRVVQAHLFHMLRPLVAKHTHVRDALARCKAGDIAAFENVLQLTEAAVRQGLSDYHDGVDDGMPEEKKAPAKAANSTGESNGTTTDHHGAAMATEGGKKPQEAGSSSDAPITTSNEAVLRCRRPWWVMQPYVRPLPEEALQKGAMTLSRKEKERLAKEEENVREVGLEPEGRVEVQTMGDDGGDVVDDPRAAVNGADGRPEAARKSTVEIARDGMVSG